ncbi:MAG: hypothetical protein NWR47_07145 [Aestuariivirgaceae bacterium]|nr:hypothetical protein [Aestuariivirgaceae bacterium]
MAHFDVMTKIRFGSRTFRLPGSVLLRVPIGVLLVIGGLLGFLPILGFWMIPVGVAVLSVDIPVVRRFRRKATVRIGLWLKDRYPALAEKLGFTNGNGNSRPRR